MVPYRNRNNWGFRSNETIPLLSNDELNQGASFKKFIATGDELESMAAIMDTSIKHFSFSEGRMIKSRKIDYGRDIVNAFRVKKKN